MAQLKAGSTVGGITIATTQDVPEKATQAEAVSGTDNNKYMTPFLVSMVLDSLDISPTIIDSVTGKHYRWGIENGAVFLEEVTS